MTKTSATGIKTIHVNELEKAKRWYADAKPQHLPLSVSTKGERILVLSKAGHVLRRD